MKSHRNSTVLAVILVIIFLLPLLNAEINQPDFSLQSTSSKNLPVTVTEFSLIWTGYHNDTVWSVAWSADSKYIVSGSEDLTAKIWYSKNGTLIRNLTHGTYIYSVNWQKNTDIVITTGNSTFKLWNAFSGMLLHTITHSTGKKIWCSAFSTNNTVATGAGDGTIKIWNASTGVLLRTLTTGSSVRALCFSPNSTYIAAGLYNHDVQVWNADTGTLIDTYTGHAGIVYTVYWSPDGSKIVSGSGTDYTVRIWNVTTGTGYIFTTLTSVVKSVQFSEDGFLILTAESGRDITIWNFTTGMSIKTLKHGTSGTLYSAKFSPDTKKIVSCSSGDYSVRCFADITKPNVVSVFTNPQSPVNATAVSINIEFNEQMDTTKNLNVTYGLYQPFDDYYVTGTWYTQNSWRGVFQIFNITPEGTYTFNISNGYDISGNLMSPFTGFQIDVDVSPPQVVYAIPTGTAPKNTIIEVMFSEIMNWSSVQDAFSISPFVSGNFKFENTKLTFVPSQNLTPDTNYTVTISSIATDLAGNHLAEYSWQFTAIEDIEPPTVIAHYPEGTNVPIDTDIKITFSELMNKTSAESAFSIVPLITGTFKWDLNTLIFTPSLKLQEATEYTVTIDTRAKDLAGNNLLSPYSWQFTTISTPLPNFEEFTERVGMGHTATVKGIAWHPTEDRIISGSEDGTVKIWSVDTQDVNLTLVHTVNADVKVYSVDYSPSGFQYASGGAGTVKIWSAENNWLATLDHGGTIVYAVKYSPDGSIIATAGNNKYIKFWRTDTFEQLPVIIDCDSSILALDFVGTDKIAAGLYNRTVTVWNITDGILEKVLIGHAGYVYCVDWTEYGNKIISGSGGDYTARIWNLTENTDYILMKFKKVVRSTRWHTSGKIVLAGTSADRKIWVLGRDASVYAILKHGKSGSLYCADWAPDGKRIASGSSGDYSVRVWADFIKPSITNVYLQPQSPVNATNLTVTVEFSEDMNIFKDINVTFGMNAPFEDYRFIGTWKTPVQWIGYYKIPQNIENGIYTLKIANASDYSDNEIYVNTDTKFEIDTVPPEVISYEPTGTKVRRTATIKIGFSEQMDKTSVEDAFSIMPFVAGTLVWTDNTCTYSLTDYLDWNTTYEITLSGAKDLAGNLLPFLKWSFTTRSATDLDCVLIEPSAITVSVGDEVQFTAHAYNGLGEEVSAAIEWSVMPQIAHISDTGLLSALDTGSCTVYANATYLGICETGTASVDIVEKEIAYVAIEPFPKIKVLCNSTVQFYARAYDTTGEIITENISYEWSLYPDELGTIDENGLFEASPTPVTGYVRVTATYRGIQKLNGTDVEVVTILNPGWLSGNVKALETGALLGDVKVYVNISGYTCYTNTTGEYNLTLPAGIYTVYAYKKGYFDFQKIDVNIYSNQTTVLNITLRLAGTIKGIVLDGTKPVARAEIIIYRADTKELVKKVFSDSAGKFEITHLELTKYDIEVLKEGYETFKTTVELTVAQPVVEVTVKLKPVEFPIGFVITAAAVCIAVSAVGIYALRTRMKRKEKEKGV